MRAATLFHSAPDIDQNCVHNEYTIPQKEKAPACDQGYLFDFYGGDGRSRTADLWVMNPSL
jgi:hypothetical protein